MSNLLGAAVEWLSATGAPNWVVIAALLTRPAMWSKQFKSRIGPLLDSALPGSSQE